MKLLVIDGNSIVNRAYYGIRMLTAPDGTPTNGIYGFLSILSRLREEFSPDAAAVAFDLHAPTFRHKLYTEYKAGRRPMPDDLRVQIPLLKELLGQMGIAVLSAEGWEADDILGTLAAESVRQGWQCVISTGDRDSLQLVGDGVEVWLAATKNGQPEVRRYDTQKIMEDYGLSPRQLIDVKALQGDSSDNIPGVAGVGEKTALSLIRQFGSLQGLYDALPGDTSLRETLKAKLAAGKENAFFSYQLGKIDQNAPVCRDLTEFVPKAVDRGGLAASLRRLGFFKYLEKWGLDGVAVPAQPTEKAEPIPAVALLEEEDAFSRCRTGEFALCREGEGWTLCLPDGICPLAELPDALLVPDTPILTNDAKALFARAEELGVSLNIVFDAALAGYLLDPSVSDYSLPRLLSQVSLPVPADEGGTACPAGAFLTLCGVLREKIKEQELEELLYSVEIPLARVLARMERVGVRIDAEATRDFGTLLGGRIEALSKEIYDAVGYEFNLNSPKQLGEALFEKLGLKAGKKTKNGYSTDAKTLEALRGAHPAVDGLLEYRKLSKLKSTYCDGLLREVAADGRIHSTFNQTETRTGRISSTEPNLQNIPVRSELGRELRRFFIAKEGCVFCDADYSQIELRVLSHMAGDEAMTEAFRTGQDIHASTAAQIFGVPLPMVTPLMRSHAKAINFGIVYGIGAYSLSQDLKISFGEAKDYIENYLHTYPGVDAYMHRVVEEAKERGWCETMLHRRRYLPELSSSNAALRAFGERVARNMPVQGTAADIIKIAMIRVDERLTREGLDARLLLQVHDELIVEAPKAEAPRVCEILREEMQGAVSLSVTLETEIHTGASWYEAK